MRKLVMIMPFIQPNYREPDIFTCAEAISSEKTLKTEWSFTFAREALEDFQGFVGYLSLEFSLSYTHDISATHLTAFKCVLNKAVETQFMAQERAQRIFSHVVLMMLEIAGSTKLPGMQTHLSDVSFPKTDRLSLARAEKMYNFRLNSRPIA